MNKMKQSPIFSVTFTALLPAGRVKASETMVWLMQHTAKFPKNQRFLMAKRMEEPSLDFYERINRAATGPSGSPIPSRG